MEEKAGATAGRGGEEACRCEIVPERAKVHTLLNTSDAGKNKTFRPDEWAER